MERLLVVASIGATCALGCRRSTWTEPIDPIDRIVAVPDTTMTLRRWVRANPTDSVTIDRPDWLPEQQGCVTAISTETHGTRVIRRLAVFTIPPPPTDYAMNWPTAQAAQGRCELQSIWVSISAADVGSARRLADSIDVVVAHQLGASRKMTSADLAGFGMRPWNDAVIWNRTGLATVGARALQYPVRVNDRDTSAWFVVAGTFVTRAWAQRNLAEAAYRLLEPDQQSTAPILDSALVLAHVPGTDTLEQLVGSHRAHASTAYGGGGLTDSISVAALRALLRAAPTLPPDRKAASLLAADLLVGHVAETLGGRNAHGEVVKSPRQSLFESEGAQFAALSYDGSQTFMHNWLIPAYEAAPASPAGRIAFRRLLAASGYPGNACGEPQYRYKRVIQLGEQALRDQFPDSGMVHRFLAQAYTDDATIGGGNRIPPTAPKTAADSGETLLAHRRALEHARLAIALSSNPTLRDDVWAMIFRLTAALPVGIHFYCEGD